MSVEFTMTRDDVIAMALRLACIYHSSVTPAAADVTNCALLLNGLVKELEDSIELSAFLSQFELEATVLANASFVVLDSTVESIYSAHYYKTSDGSRIPMKPMTVREAFERRAETQAAATDEIYYAVSERTSGTDLVTGGGAISSRVMYFWPAIPGNGKIYYLPKLRIDIFDNSADTGFFPQSWYRYLVFRLAADAALFFGAPLERYQALVTVANESYARLGMKQVKAIKTLVQDDKPGTAEKARK